MCGYDAAILSSHISKYQHDAFVSRGKVKNQGRSSAQCAECQSSGVCGFLLESTILNIIWQSYINIFLPRAYVFSLVW